MLSHVAQGWLFHSLHVLLVQHQTDISLDTILLPIMISLAFPPNLSCLAIGQSSYWLEQKEPNIHSIQKYFTTSVLLMCVCQRDKSEELVRHT